MTQYLVDRSMHLAKAGRRGDKRRFAAKLLSYFHQKVDEDMCVVSNRTGIERARTGAVVPRDSAMMRRLLARNTQNLDPFPIKLVKSPCSDELSIRSPLRSMGVVRVDKWVSRRWVL